MASLLIKVKKDGKEKFYDCESVVLDQDEGLTTLTCYDRVDAKYVELHLEGDLRGQVAVKTALPQSAPDGEEGGEEQGGRRRRR
jgi:hypothetical protein